MREEGSNLAESLQSPFIDVSQEENRLKEGEASSSSQKQLDKQDSCGSSLFNERLVEEALRALIESIRHRSGILNIYNNKTPVCNNEEPDIRYFHC